LAGCLEISMTNINYQRNLPAPFFSQREVTYRWRRRAGNVGNIAGCFLVALFAFGFLSCDRTERNNQNAQSPQGADSILERILDMTEEDTIGAVHQTMYEPGLAQAVAWETEHAISMTLVPSVQPELLRNVMPNSWHRLERLTEDEERAFLRENAHILLQVERDLRNARLGFGSRSWHDGMWHRRGGFDYFSIYRQKIGLDTFHRIIVTADSAPDFTSRSIWFAQFLVHGNILLGSAPYTSVSFTQWGFVGSFNSIDIISGKEGARGILITEVSLGVTAYDYD